MAEPDPGFMTKSRLLSTPGPYLPSQEEGIKVSTFLCAYSVRINVCYSELGHSFIYSLALCLFHLLHNTYYNSLRI